jgi:LmbE family N-acetylglucosaminyl deacetylase/ubiquinone/menaquinone biosynthesis C-methylase UbiE
MNDRLRLMCILAHPDDESLGTGGILAKYAAEGVGTYLVTATRGERGWSGAPEVNPGLRALGQRREDELQGAAHTLGVREVQLLGYLDGDLDKADVRDIVYQLVGALRRVRPQVVVTFDPSGVYGHPDHIAISQFTMAAIVSAADSAYHYPDCPQPHCVSKVYYLMFPEALLNRYQAVFGRLSMEIDGVERGTLAIQDWIITTQIDTRAFWRQVWSAIRCHESQVGSIVALSALTDDAHCDLWGTQTFFRVYSTVNGRKTKRGRIMTNQSTAPTTSEWADEKMKRRLLRRVEGFWNQDYFERIVLPLLDLQQGATLLDVGCGYGALALLLARTRPDLKVIGIDPVDQAINAATQAAAEMKLPNAHFHKGDGHEIPYDNNSFDSCVCQTVLAHVTDARKVVSEMARVIRPGAKFLAVEYHNTGATTTFLNVADELLDARQRMELFRLQLLYIKGKKALGLGDEQVGMRIAAMAQDAGLEIVDIRLNDRAIYAIPPYRRAHEQMTIENLREWNADEELDPTTFNRLSQCIRAGGGTQYDVDQYIQITENAGDRRNIRAAIAENRLYYMSQWPWFLTFARKVG